MEDTCSNMTFRFVAPMWIVFIVVPLGGLSIAIFILEVIIVWSMRLCSKIVYRLALYQASCAVVYSTVILAGYVLLHYLKFSEVIGYSILAYFTMAKFMFNMWLTVHLFFFAVCYKNCRKLEPLYVSSSLILPLLASAVYLVINVPFGCQLIRRGFSAILIVAGLILALTSVIVVAIFAVLLRRNCKSNSSVGRHNRTAIKEMLPLIGYPLVIAIAIAPIAMIISAMAISNKSLLTPNFMHGVFAIVLQCFNFFSIIFLMVHIGVVTIIKKCEKKSIISRRRYYDDKLCPNYS